MTRGQFPWLILTRLVNTQEATVEAQAQRPDGELAIWKRILDPGLIVLLSPGLLLLGGMPRLRRVGHLPLALACLLGCQAGMVKGGQAEHVVVVVWDGMRPDFVTAQYTPALDELAKRGTFFKNHHSSYVTSTEVNGTALGTGVYPDHSGILANVQYRPELSWLWSFGTESLDAIRRGDLLWDGHYLGVPTVAEILQLAGIPSVTAGAKPVVLLLDRGARKSLPAQRDSVTLFRGRTLPRSVLRSLVAIPEVGPFPGEAAKPDSIEARILHWITTGRDKTLTWLNGKPKNPPLSRQVDAWTTQAVIQGLWKNGVSKYTLLWLSEPDSSQHEMGPGSPDAEMGLEESDKNLALVIKALKDKGVLEHTDIMVVSDHGFSTVDRGPDLIKSLKRANFIAGTEFDNPEAGDVMVVSLGGSAFFYVFDHDKPTIQRLVEFLQGSDFAGVIFSAIPVEGTFPLSQVHLDTGSSAPDVVVSMRWSSDRNDWGTPGLVVVPGGHRGGGTHASLSRFDLHNTLVAAGPDFKSGFVSDLSSGNVDIAPTVLAILGVPQPKPMDGRVLSESFTGGDLTPPKAEHQTLEASRDLGFRQWHQFLKVSRVGSVLYYDEGNGESRLK
jgi:predicted AlkP superfamily pyrophosphatase or phosphodiesterase